MRPEIRIGNPTIARPLIRSHPPPGPAPAAGIGRGRTLGSAATPRSANCRRRLASKAASVPGHARASPAGPPVGHRPQLFDPDGLRPAKGWDADRSAQPVEVDYAADQGQVRRDLLRGHAEPESGLRHERQPPRLSRRPLIGWTPIRRSPWRCGTDPRQRREQGVAIVEGNRCALDC